MGYAIPEPIDLEPPHESCHHVEWPTEPLDSRADTHAGQTDDPLDARHIRSAHKRLHRVGLNESLGSFHVTDQTDDRIAAIDERGHLFDIGRVTLEAL